MPAKYRITTDQGTYEVTTDEGPPEESHPIIEGAKSFGSGFLQGVNPFHGALETLQKLAEDPVGTVKNGAIEVLAHPYMALGRAWDAAKQGKDEEAAAHIQSAFLPAGAQTEEGATKAATPGQRLEGVGQLAGEGIQALVTGKAGEKAPAAAQGVTNTIRENPRGAQVVGGAVGAAAGHMTGVHYVGPVVGAEVGRRVAAAIVDRLKLPSEAGARPLLDEISLTPEYGGKPFEKLSAPEQAHVRSIADAIEGKKPPGLPPPGPTKVDIGPTGRQSLSAPPRPREVDVPGGEQPGSIAPRGSPQSIQAPPGKPTLPQSGLSPVTAPALARAPLTPPLAEKTPPLPEQPPEAPGKPAGPVTPPVHKGANAYLGGEEAPSAPEAANRAKVADKIGTALAKAGVTDEHLTEIEALPPAQARKFWEAAGGIHREGYVPSSGTIDGIRAVVKEKQASGPKLVVKPKSVPLPAHLANNPKAASAARSLSEMMNEK